MRRHLAMAAVGLLLGVALSATRGRCRAGRWDWRTGQCGVAVVGAYSPSAWFEFAPNVEPGTAGTGLSAECACTNVTSAQGNVVTVTRASAIECLSSDGQRLTQCGNNLPAISSGAVDQRSLGIWGDIGATNQVLHNRRMSSDAGWTWDNVSCSIVEGSGLRADGGARCCATTDGGRLIYDSSLKLSGSNFAVSAFLKWSPGGDGGTVEWQSSAASPFVNITSSLDSQWKRLGSTEMAGCTSVSGIPASRCIRVPSAKATQALPVIRFGAANTCIDVDFFGAEVNSLSRLGQPTIPIETGAASVARAAQTVSVALPGTAPRDGGSASGYAVTQYQSSGGWYFMYFDSAGRPAYTNSGNQSIWDGTSDTTYSWTFNPDAGGINWYSYWRDDAGIKAQGRWDGGETVGSYDRSFTSGVSTVLICNGTSEAQAVQGVCKHVCVDHDWSKCRGTAVVK